MFRSRVITHTDWSQYCIANKCLKLGDLYLSHDLPYHDQLTPDSAPSFSGINTSWMIENWKVVDFFVCSEKNLFKNIIKEQIRNLREKLRDGLK